MESHADGAVLCNDNWCYPNQKSVRCVHSWEPSVTSADTPATISFSCKLSLFYAGYGTIQQGKTSAFPIHLGLQVHTCCPDECCPAESDASTCVSGEAGQFGPCVALHCPCTWASAFKAGQEPRPDSAVHTHTLQNQGLRKWEAPRIWLTHCRSLCIVAAYLQ